LTITWVSNYPKNSVTRIDPKANKIVETIAVGKGPCSGLAAGFGSLWVPNCGDPSVSRIDPKTGKVTGTLPLTIGDSEGGLPPAGSVWMMTDKKGTLARIDPQTSKVVAEVRSAWILRRRGLARAPSGSRARTRTC
jgi:YVTN family beta-propeller protein